MTAEQAPGLAVRLVPGEIIPGTRYRLMAKIGQGAMGAVYAALHEDLEKKVAVKILLARYASNRRAVERFRLEARAASKIGSPYICDVTDFGELSDGRVFLVMEYIEGISLRAVLSAEGRVTPARGIGLLRQVAKALGASHDKGVVHLDVKPDNVMILERHGRPDAVKVVDFGVAGLLALGVVRNDTVTGTPAYVAPERALGRGYDHRSDIYALGAVAYEMLAGSPPFENEDVATMLQMHVSTPPEPLRQRAPLQNIPPDLETAILQMLAKDPDARPQSMAVVEGLLCEAQIAAGLTTPWDDLDLPPVDEEWRKKLDAGMPKAAGRPHRKIQIAILVTAVLALAGVAFGLLRKPREVTVTVEVTQTAEKPEVAEWLFRAERAVRAGRYVLPSEDSALYYVERAEAEAVARHTHSPGAGTLRRVYASALAVTGDELLKAGLRDLAIAKFKEALLFRPGDADLAAKAELTPAERKARAGGHGPTRPPPSSDDDARRIAADIYLAAQQGNFSQARAAVPSLLAVDLGGGNGARIADALRRRAQAAWQAGETAAARPLYEIILELDPKDGESRARLAPVQVPGPEPAPDPAIAKARRPEVAADDHHSMPRDATVARAAAEAGMAALARGRLDEAEAAFNRAVRADPENASAVGGVAEVAFERARYAEALDYGRRATKLAPRASKFHIIVGDAYFKLLRYAEAKSAYETARALAPKDQRIRGRLERVRAKLGK